MTHRLWPALTAETLHTWNGTNTHKNTVSSESKWTQFSLIITCCVNSYLPCPVHTGLSLGVCRCSDVDHLYWIQREHNLVCLCYRLLFEIVVWFKKMNDYKRTAFIQYLIEIWGFLEKHTKLQHQKSRFYHTHDVIIEMNTLNMYSNRLNYLLWGGCQSESEMSWGK